jgi:hypothetical protein
MAYPCIDASKFWWSEQLLDDGIHEEPMLMRNIKNVSKIPLGLGRW